MWYQFASSCYQSDTIEIFDDNLFDEDLCVSSEIMINGKKVDIYEHFNFEEEEIESESESESESEFHKESDDNEDDAQIEIEKLLAKRKTRSKKSSSK